MPLSQDTLKQNLISAFKKTFDVIKGPVPGSPPNVPLVVAQNLAIAYDQYVISGSPSAGVLKMISPGQTSLLAAALTAPMLAGWTPGLVSYWTPVLWAGSGFVPANPTVTVNLSFLPADLAALISRKSSTLEEAADRLSSLLHSYSTRISVFATTSTVPPIVSTIPII